MSIIKAVQDYLTEFEGLELVETDRVGGEAGSYALAQSSGGTSSTDILGNRTYVNGYLFLAREHAGEEGDRRDNYDFLEAFCAWLEERTDQGALPLLPSPYRAVGVTVANVMLMDVEENGVGTYQVQLQLTFRKDADR